MFQDENHQLLIEQKQIQTKYIKFNEEILSLRQEIQEVLIYPQIIDKQKISNKLIFIIKKDRLLEEECERIKKFDYIFSELNSKLEAEKRSFNEISNQKKDLNEIVISLEKQVFKILFLQLYS